MFLWENKCAWQFCSWNFFYFYFFDAEKSEDKIQESIRKLFRKVKCLSTNLNVSQ